MVDDPRDSLYREFVGIVAKLEPQAFLMENVAGLEQMGVKEQVLDDQRGCGNSKANSEAAWQKGVA